MKAQIINPANSIYPATDDYAHAIEIRGFRRIIFVSGTMGLDAEGQAPAALQDQLRLIWANIRCILADAGLGLDNIVRVTSYLTDATFAPANQEARMVALGSRRVATTAIVVGTLSSDWLAEIEVIAAA